LHASLQCHDNLQKFKERIRRALWKKNLSCKHLFSWKKGQMSENGICKNLSNKGKKSNASCVPLQLNSKGRLK